MRTPSLLLGLAALLAVPAVGQALRGHNTKSPVDVEADRIEVQDRADRAVFSGNVIVRQAELNLTAARLTVAYARERGNVDIDRIDASGGVFIRSASETARGDFAVYDLNRRIITVLGNVELNQGANRVRGGRLVIDLESGRAIMDGQNTGSSAGNLRVSGRFTVSDRKN